MRTLFFFFSFCIFLFSSCSEDDNQLEFPRTFVFNNSQIVAEKGIVVGDNESYREIDSRSGNLDNFRSEVALDLFGYVRNQGFGNYIESITLLNQESVRINYWDNGNIISLTLPADLDNVDGEIIDKSLYGHTLVWDKINQELKYCLSLSLGILYWANNLIPEVTYDYCISNNIDQELQIKLAEYDFEKNDTIGIYMVDVVYK
jgi:hypothetical protein